MKANELMIGDWVFVNDVEHLRPMMVGEIKRKSGKHYACLYDPNDVSEHCECIIEKVVGIRLGKMFLTRNNFEYYKDSDAWIRQVDKTTISVVITESGVILNIDVIPLIGLRAGVRNLSIKYVHEFQHLCTMCNIKIDWKA